MASDRSRVGQGAHGEGGDGPAPSPKVALRRALRARRRARAGAADPTASGSLTAAVLGHPAWQRASGVAAFVGVVGEPDTRALLEAALEQGRSLWLPRVLDAKAGRSVLVAVDDLADLVPTRGGLVEPRVRAEERTRPSITADAGIDLVLVPGLAFSSAGARIGHGPGHYDRLLAPIAARPIPVRMGVCLAADLDPPEGPIPMDAHDVWMHHVATELGVIECGGD